MSDEQKRLEYLREQIVAENISYGEIAELQDLKEHIDKGDVLLLEWAGVDEYLIEDNCQNCQSLQNIYLINYLGDQKWSCPACEKKQ